ncbi:MAG: hypothetical protein AAGB15_10510 [Pseudomonadota bacterium]
MKTKLPDIPAEAERYSDLIGLIGLMRLAMFEAFGDRKFWDERYFDLFLSMLAKQLRGSVSTMEEMTAAVRGVSHSTKMRMIEEARGAGLIQAVARSQIALDEPLDDASARKVFFLTDKAMASMTGKLSEVDQDVHAFTQRHGANGGL